LLLAFLFSFYKKTATGKKPVSFSAGLSAANQLFLSFCKKNAKNKIQTIQPDKSKKSKLKTIRK